MRNDPQTGNQDIWTSIWLPAKHANHERHFTEMRRSVSGWEAVAYVSLARATPASIESRRRDGSRGASVPVHPALDGPHRLVARWEIPGLQHFSGVLLLCAPRR